MQAPREVVELGSSLSELGFEFAGEALRESVRVAAKLLEHPGDDVQSWLDAGPQFVLEPLALSTEAPVRYSRPSIDVTFHSAADAYALASIAVDFHVGEVVEPNIRARCGRLPRGRLGHLLHYGRELNAMDQVIGVMLIIVVIGLLADKILFSPWERFLHRRWGTLNS